MTTILAFDTTAARCAVALWRDGAVLAERCEPMERGHAEALVPMILDTLADAGAGFDDLDAVAATTGPGAFTGIRIGLGAARGIALAAGIPAIGVDAFAAIAAAIRPAAARGRPLIVAIDTKRGDFYARRFTAEAPDAKEGTGWRADGDPAALAAAGVAALAGGPVHLAGDGARAAADALRAAGLDATVAEETEPPAPKRLAAIAAARLASGAPIEPPRPLYLREPEARLPPRAASLAP